MVGSVEERIARQEQWAKDHAISCDERNTIITKEFKKNGKDHKEMLDGIKDITECIHERTQVAYATLEKKNSYLARTAATAIMTLLGGYIYIFYNGLPW